MQSFFLGGGKLNIQKQQARSSCFHLCGSSDGHFLHPFALRGFGLKPD